MEGVNDITLQLILSWYVNEVLCRNLVTWMGLSNFKPGLFSLTWHLSWYTKLLRLLILILLKLWYEGSCSWHFSSNQSTINKAFGMSSSSTYNGASFPSCQKKAEHGNRVREKTNKTYLASENALYRLYNEYVIRVKELEIIWWNPVCLIRVILGFISWSDRKFA